MLPRVDLPDLIDVMAWQRGFVAAFAGVSGGRSRLADLHVTIAAALTAHALNVGYVPVISGRVPALDRVPRLRREQAIPCEVETNLVDLLVPARVVHEQGDLDAVVDV